MPRNRLPKIHQRDWLLPDGTITTSADRYAKAWVAMGDHLRAALGVRVHVFDPGFCVVPDDGRAGGSAVIPMWLANRILALTPPTIVPRTRKPKARK